MGTAERIGAQRLSASKIGSLRAAPKPARAIKSAQRLSASKIGSLRKGQSYEQQRDVLNACRHQRSVHQPAPTGNFFPASCSTPVGIKDRFTQKGGKGGTLCYGCSTPVGIKDRFTASMWFRFLLVCWCSTPVGIKDRFTDASIGMIGAMACAQRLSASKIGSLCGRVNRDDRWHAMCSTPVGIKDRFTSGLITSRTCLLPVLNACRHQRSVHPQAAEGVRFIGTCSTPVGIKDRFTHS